MRFLAFFLAILVSTSQASATDICDFPSGAPVQGDYCFAAHDDGVAGYSVTADDMVGYTFTSGGTFAADVDFSGAQTELAVPNFTTSARNSITSPKTGSVIWNSTSSQIEVYTGATWTAGGAEDYPSVLGGGTESMIIDTDSLGAGSALGDQDINIGHAVSTSAVDCDSTSPGDQNIGIGYGNGTTTGLSCGNHTVGIGYDFVCEGTNYSCIGDSITANENTSGKSGFVGSDITCTSCDYTHIFASTTSVTTSDQSGVWGHNNTLSSLSNTYVIGNGITSASANQLVTDLVFEPGQFATGSLPTASTYEGNIAYDTTTNTIKFSDGTSWLSTAKETESFCAALSDENTTDLATGTANFTFRMPYAFTVTAVRASVATAPVGSTIIVDINESGTTIMNTNKLSIDASEKTSTTAATAAGVTDANIADDAEITMDIDQVGSGTAGKGLKVCIIGNKA